MNELFFSFFQVPSITVVEAMVATGMDTPLPAVLVYLTKHKPDLPFIKVKGILWSCLGWR